MKRESDPVDNVAEALPRAVEHEEGSPTRRAFLLGTVRKAVYVTPVVLTLSASQVRAGSVWDSTCGDEGSPCTLNEECCSLMCTDPGSGMKACAAS